MVWSKYLTAAAMAGVLALSAHSAASAAPLASALAEHAANAESEGDPIVQKVGHRHYKRRYHGGITYVGPHGLKYAPRYYRHRGSGVSVTIHIGPRYGYRYRQRARPWIYDVKRGVTYSGLTASHYRWCDARYRSYRYRDNTFQPYNGPRRQCRSPYM